jgi:hypothetical protein
MSVTAVNHFTILTDDLPATLAFYEEHLQPQARRAAAVHVPGAWLYADGGKGPEPDPAHRRGAINKERLVKGVLDHMPTVAKGSPRRGKTEGKNIRTSCADCRNTGTWQLFFFDPNCAKIEIDFDKVGAGAHLMLDLPRRVGCLLLGAG